MAAPYQDTYWYPSGTLAAFAVARVFPRHSNTLATLWQDAAETIPKTNPAILTVGGVLAFYAAPGDYWIRVGDESFPVSIDGDAIVDDVWPETFEYEQVAPAATWLITHNLNAFPDATILVGGQHIVGVPVLYPDLNTVSINFGTPQSGTVVLRR